MLTFYSRRSGRIVNEQARAGEPMPEGLVWADMIEPTLEDLAQIRRVANIDVPTPEEMREIEPSSRLYREGLALFMTASVLSHADSQDPETRAITFVLAEGLLTTIRYTTPAPFLTFQSRIQSQPELCASAEIALAELLDAIVDRIADTMESVDANVSALSKTIFAPLGKKKGGPRDYSEELKAIGLSAVRCSKVDESLVGLSRLLTFFDANMRLVGQKQVRVRIKDLQRDILSLMGYVERQSEKLQMLLEATLGMVNIQQNNIIKIFSVIAVVFLPPTLVASIYGMNFRVMPELDWVVGYPLALLMMLVSAVGPYLYFRRRGWL
jgi:magnesium transporter